VILPQIQIATPRLCRPPLATPGRRHALLAGRCLALLAAGALTLGGCHRRFVVPRLAAGEPVGTIRRTLTLELGLLLAVLALAAVLSQTAPPG
jgi:putative copper export protein